MSVTFGCWHFLPVAVLLWPSWDSGVRSIKNIPNVFFVRSDCFRSAWIPPHDPHASKYICESQLWVWQMSKDALWKAHSGFRCLSPISHPEQHLPPLHSTARSVGLSNEVASVPTWKERRSFLCVIDARTFHLRIPGLRVMRTNRWVPFNPNKDNLNSWLIWRPMKITCRSLISACFTEIKDFYLVSLFRMKREEPETEKLGIHVTNAALWQQISCSEQLWIHFLMCSWVIRCSGRSVSDVHLIWHLIVFYGFAICLSEFSCLIVPDETQVPCCWSWSGRPCNFNHLHTCMRAETAYCFVCEISFCLLRDCFQEDLILAQVFMWFHFSSSNLGFLGPYCGTLFWTQLVRSSG